MTPSKSMPQKSNHDFRAHVYLDHFCRTPAFKKTSKTHKDIKSGKEVKTITFFDISLHYLIILIMLIPKYMVNTQTISSKS